MTLSASEYDTGHSVLMDRTYRHQRLIYDFTRRYFLLGRDRLIGGLGVPPGGKVLEIGCGTARNLIAAAQAYPQANFFGVDISSEMLVSACRAAGRSGLKQNLRFAQCDATSLDAAHCFGIQAFDRVFFSYALSMIPDWQLALHQAVLRLKPGGSLHVVDFGQQERLPFFFRRVLFTWLRWFHVSPRADLREALQELARGCGGEVEFRSLHHGYAWLAVLTRVDERSGP